MSGSVLGGLRQCFPVKGIVPDLNQTTAFEVFGHGREPRRGTTSTGSVRATAVLRPDEGVHFFRPIFSLSKRENSNRRL
jgi:hypothetical protein